MAAKELGKRVGELDRVRVSALDLVLVRHDKGNGGQVGAALLGLGRELLVVAHPEHGHVPLLALGSGDGGHAVQRLARLRCVDLVYRDATHARLCL